MIWVCSIRGIGRCTDYSIHFNCAIVRECNCSAIALTSSTPSYFNLIIVISRSPEKWMDKFNICGDMSATCICIELSFYSASNSHQSHTMKMCYHFISLFHFNLTYLLFFTHSRMTLLWHVSREKRWNLSGRFIFRMVKHLWSAHEYL